MIQIMSWVFMKKKSIGAVYGSRSYEVMKRYHNLHNFSLVDKPKQTWITLGVLNMSYTLATSRNLMYVP